jgi:hypothetical protein
VAANGTIGDREGDMVFEDRMLGAEDSEGMGSVSRKSSDSWLCVFELVRKDFRSGSEKRPLPGLHIMFSSISDGTAALCKCLGRQIVEQNFLMCILSSCYRFKPSGFLTPVTPNHMPCFVKHKLALVPPNPKLLVMATLMSFSCAAFDT